MLMYIDYKDIQDANGQTSNNLVNNSANGSDVVIKGKSGKKICCSCPETRKPRDECVVIKGESECKELIEAHNKCLREEGFKI